MDDNDTGYYNDSYLDSYVMPKFVASEHLQFVFISIFTVFMNSCVILLFSFNKNLRKPCNFLLLSLSVSDLLTGAVGLPLLLVCSTTGPCLPCVFSYSFIVFTSISTVLHILVISCERYIKIVLPFRMQHIGRASFELKLIACLWFISIIVPPIQYIWYPPTEASCFEEITEENARNEKIYTISIMIIFFGVPVLLLLYADISVFFVVRRQLDGIDKTSVGVRDSQKRVRKERRVLALFNLMMLYFVVAWSFYYAFLIIYPVLEGNIKVSEWVIKLMEILRTSTPLVNPILYILLKHDFRRVVCNGLRKFVNKYAGAKHARSTRNGPTICHTDSRNVTERTVFV